MPNEVQVMEANEVEVRHQHETILSQAQTLASSIRDDISFKEAGKFLVAIKTKLNAWQNKMAPAVKAAFDAHRKLTQTVLEIADPLRKAEAILKPAMAKYDWDQREKARVERERLEREERARQEEARLEMAAELEKSGKKEQADDVLNMPITAAPVKEPELAKTEGITYRDYWSFEVIDAMELVKAVAAGVVPLMAVLPNDKFLGQQARALKEQFKFPGVRLIHDRTSNVKGGF